VAQQLRYLEIVGKDLTEGERGLGHRAQLELAEKIHEGGITGTAGEAWVIDFMKQYGEHAHELESAYLRKKKLVERVEGYCIPVSVKLVGRGTFTWAIQDINSMVARQLVRPELMGHPDCRTDIRIQFVKGEEVSDGFMGGRQASAMKEAFEGEPNHASNRLLVPLGFYLYGSCLDRNMNATALPMVLQNHMFSYHMHNTLRTL
jgi:hypothetical protein